METELTLETIAKMIDHAALSPTCTDVEMMGELELAKRYGVAALCVKPYAVAMAAAYLAGDGPAVCAVTGFPHGNSAISVKLVEAREAMAQGATEVDVVVNVGKVLGGDWEYTSREIRSLNDLVAGRGGLLKVIFETVYLEELHVKKLCDICSEAAVAFAKTSTGFGLIRHPDGRYEARGADEGAVALMRRQLASHVQIKASGGIGTLDALLRFRSLGATRIGASATRSILEEAQRRGQR